MDWNDIWPGAQHVIFPVTRWLHIVAVTLLVGGTMFYEWVVPIAIEDLKNEQQLNVFGRARWFFRRIVFVSVIVLALTGIINATQMWRSYHLFRPSLLAVSAHVVLAAVGMGIALWLTVPNRPPERPVRWMRVNLVILLVAIFTADVARHVRITLRERDEVVVQKANEMRARQQRPLQTPGAATQPGDPGDSDASR